jgi:hypothetical protein
MRRKYTAAFGKIRLEPGMPKSAPRWVWCCTCGCGAIVGPFKRLRDAEADAEATMVRAFELDCAQDEAREAVHH